MFACAVVRLTDNLPRILAVCIICLSLTACEQEPAASSDKTLANAVDKAQTDRKQAAQKTEAALAALTGDDLRKMASTAYREQRLYAPAGNNAVEYYLAIRKKSDKPDVLTESALMDLTPYTIIAAEQSISRLEFDEAIRLRDLIAEVDANAPALPRISQAISAGLKNSEAIAVAAEREASIAAEQAAMATAQTKTKPAELAAATKTVVALAPAPEITAPSGIIKASDNAVMPAIVPNRMAPAASAPAKKSELVAIRTPDPGYPSEALNKGLSGAVEIEFVVQRNGEVSDVRIVNSSQRAFDRNVMTTVKRWKFAPMDEPMTVRRSFNFSNPS